MSFSAVEESAGLTFAVSTLTGLVLLFGALCLYRRDGTVGAAGSGETKKPALDKSEWRQFPLILKQQISPNTALYRFSLPSKDQSLDLPIGQHVSVRALLDGKEVMRSYTPTSLPTDLGYFDLVIKTYPNGMLSGYFDRLVVGDKVEVRGPKGSFRYSPNMCKAIGMIAGGTGITPMLQVVRAILSNPSDKTKVSLIFANVNENDILLREDIDKLVAGHSNFSVHYVLNNPPSGWTGGVGFVTKQMIADKCPAPAADTKILLCGPPPMVKAMQQNCEDLGFEKARALSKLEDQIFKF